MKEVRHIERTANPLMLLFEEDIDERAILKQMVSRHRYIGSPLNYIGGKGKLLSQILPLFPKHISTFVDLFCGGCNVGLNAEAERVICNDNLSYLIDLYNEFQCKSTEEVLSYITNRIEHFALSLTNADGYLRLREAYNTERQTLDLFVLIAFSFNHQIRFNNSHEFNNPFGRERSCFNEHMKRKLIEFLYAVHSKNVEFRSSDFKQYPFETLKAADFVYADPPYLITTGTYNDGKRGFTGWNEEEEKALLDILEQLDSRHIRFALSNVTEHKGRENKILKTWIAEHGFVVNSLQKSYSNSNYHTNNCDKGETAEVLVTNYRPEKR